MSTHQAVRFVIKSLILASAITGFSTCGFAEYTNFSKVDYESSCAACHGQNGKGDGPVSEELRTRPSDLTLIAKKNGGVFPIDVVYRIIDGRGTLRAHGSYEMPVGQRHGSAGLALDYKGAASATPYDTYERSDRL
jgi:mono/diheme cytochrome c family protein